jgi:hypothetical protein
MDPGAITRDGAAIDAAIARAQPRVMVRHRQLGMPIAIWRDGRVVEIPPESIRIPDENDDSAWDDNPGTP